MEYRAMETICLGLPAPLPVTLFSGPRRNGAAAQAANENIPIKSDWMTPAEALQAIGRIKNRLRAEHCKTQSLFYSAGRRRTWDEVNACEACLRWMYFRNI